MPTRQRRRVGTRGRILLVIVVVLLIFLLLSVRGLAGVWTDYLWFDSLQLSSVWRDILLARFGLGALFATIFFVLCYTSLTIADRLAPSARAPGPEEELVQRWQGFIGGRAWLVRVLVAGVLGLIAGAGFSSQWERFLLFLNRVDFGTEDPQFGMDAGFYVFELPFMTQVVTWSFTAIFTIFIVTTVAHYLNGGIRLQARGQRVTPHVKAHLSVLLALLALIKAAGYYFDRFELVLGSRGFRDGASYTDIHAQLPAINLLILISLFSFGLLIFNIWARGWTYPLIAVGLWALVALVAGTIYPTIVQRVRVEPSESAREQPYIERNIEATRHAMGIGEVEERTFEFDPDLDGATLRANRESVENVRLLDPSIVVDTFEELESFRGFYDFRDVDVDRYMIDGELTQVVLATRELDSGGLPNQSWESEYLAFTHGYGVVAAPANRVTDAGEPEFVLGDIPVETRSDAPDLELTEPGIYHGEGVRGYAIVGAERSEVNFESDAGNREVNRYLDEGGQGGVDVSGTGLGGMARRAAFALRFAQPNLLISGQIKDDSKILYIRDVRERVEKVAPFLALDADPYPIVVDGRVTWVLDAYTTTDRYPYAQGADTVGVSDGSGLGGGFNYVRNSVKVTVDAIDGDVTLWVVDEEDPLVRAYEKMFPVLFEHDPPEGLRAHFRYPEDLFKIQTNMWGRYRLDDPDQFYEGTAGWDVSQDPGTRIAEQATETVTDEQGVSRTIEARIDPQYLLLRLPGDTEESFLMFRPFVPARQEGEGSTDDQSRRNLTGFMVARSDPDSYGRLEVFDVSSTGGTVTGPVQFDANTMTDAEITRQLTLLNTEGSRVRAGNLLLIPIENTLVYVRPIYVEATTTTALPRLQEVIVGVGDRLAMRPTFAEALDAVIPGLGATGTIDQGGPEPGATGEQPGTGEQPDTGEQPGTGEQPDTGEQPPAPTDDGEELPTEVDEWLQRADEAFEAAEQALDAGDLGEYQTQVDQARDALRQAQDLISGPTTTAPAAAGEAGQADDGGGTGGGDGGTTTTEGGQGGGGQPATSAPVGEA